MVPIRTGFVSWDFSIESPTGTRLAHQEWCFGSQAGWPTHLLQGPDSFPSVQRASPIILEDGGNCAYTGIRNRTTRRKIKWAAIYGSIARGQEQAQSDVDLLIVGRVGMAELLPVLRRVERQFGREVNVTRFSENEFRERLHSKDHFLKSVIKGKLIAIMGSLNELEKAAGRK